MRDGACSKKIDPKVKRFGVFYIQSVRTSVRPST